MHVKVWLCRRFIRLELVLLFQVILSDIVAPWSTVFSEARVIGCCAAQHATRFPFFFCSDGLLCRELFLL